MINGYTERQMQDAYYRVKSAVDAWRRESGLSGFNSSAIAQLYAMSPYMFTAGNIRSQAISRLKFVAYEGEDALPDIHPLQVLLNGDDDFTDLMSRIELSMSFFGWSLAFVTRSYTNRPINLSWVNPTTVQRDISGRGGLEGFRVYVYGANNTELEDQIENGYIPMRNALYFNGIDFFDDHDGIAPAESALRSVLASVEIDETTLAIFKNGAVPAMAIQPTADAKDAIEIAGSGEGGVVAQLTDRLRRMFKGARNQGKVLINPTRWEYHPLQPPFKDVNTSDVDMQLAKKISASFQVPLSLILPSEVTSGLSRNEDGRNWAYSWVLPRGHWYASKMTSVLASHYGSQFSIRLDESSVPFLQPTPKEKIAMIDTRVNMGILSLQSAQEQADGVVDELLGDEPLYKVGDDWVKSSMVANWGIYRLQVAPSTTLGGIFPDDLVPYDPSANEQAIQQQYAEAAVLNAESQAEESEAEAEATEAEADVLEEEAQLVEAETEQVEEDIEDETTKSKNDNEAYVSLSLASNSKIGKIQDKYKRLYKDIQGVEWTEPERFHITLAYAQDIDDDSLYIATSEVYRPDMVISTHSISTFPPHGGRQALVLLVNPSSALVSYQRMVYGGFSNEGVSMSEYSDPKRWNPHITLGYLPDTIDIDKELLAIDIDVSGVNIQRGDYVDVEITPPDETTKRHVPYEWYQELDTYTNFIRKRGFSKAVESFEFAHIPQHIVRFIADTYDEDNPDGDVFVKARDRMAYKSIQSTRLDYESDVETLLQRALNGRMPEAVFRDRMRAIHRRYMPLAYEDGLIEGGVPDGDMTEDDRSKINRFITSQTPYIRDLARTLYADDNQITEDEIAGKPAMWFNKSIYPAYLKGKASANRNANFEWVMGNTEHCADCKRLNGQIHRMSAWERRGWIPKADKLECGGFNCKCDLVKSDRRARGNW